MDFSLTPDLIELRDRTRRFIADEVIPFEADPRLGAHGPGEDLRRDLNVKARAAGLLTPHASKDLGGLGLSHIAKAVVFEAAGYSALGPLALNIQAPDEGNIHLMEAVATPAQKARWLVPQVKGEIRSCFAMTEPPPGAGSDPSMLTTTAVRDGDAYVINGTKWFITGANGAAYVIVMARMEDGSATMFLADMNAEGITITRQMEAMDRSGSRPPRPARARRPSRRSRRPGRPGLARRSAPGRRSAAIQGVSRSCPGRADPVFLHSRCSRGWVFALAMVGPTVCTSCISAATASRSHMVGAPSTRTSRATTTISRSAR